MIPDCVSSNDLQSCFREELFRKSIETKDEAAVRMLLRRDAFHETKKDQRDSLPSWLENRNVSIIDNAHSLKVLNKNKETSFRMVG